MSKEKKAAFSFIAEIDEAELALRLAEIACDMRRPPNSQKSAREHLDELERTWPPEGGPFPFKVMARRAIEYMGECVERGQRTS